MKKPTKTSESKADLSLPWMHMPFCRFCHVLAHIFSFHLENICCGYPERPLRGTTYFHYTMLIFSNVYTPSMKNMLWVLIRTALDIGLT